MTKNTKIGIGVGGLVLAAIVAWLAIGVFGVHTLFIDDEVSEANPFADQAAVAVVAEADEPAASADASSDAAPAGSTEAQTAESGTGETEPVAADETSEADEAAPAVPEIVTLAQGMLVDHDHSGTGTATVITDGNRRFLRFEDDFAVDNGPDLNVYLSRNAPATGDAGLFDDDFIDLGDLKGNIGAQNYELADDVDLSEYNTVVIWCVRFGVAFNAADLVPPA